MMPTDPARWPRPGQPAWDSTDYARDFQWLGQPREGVEPPPRLTVREWFRRDRAAMWQSPTHPAHAIAQEIDDLGAAVVDIVDLPARYFGRYCIAYWGDDNTLHSTGLWVPSALLVERREAAAQAAISDLLLAAWPIADREKYDETYALIRRTQDEMVAWRKRYFEGLTS